MEDKLLAALVARIEAGITVGDPLHPSTTMGPMVSHGQRDHVVAQIKQASQPRPRPVHWCTPGPVLLLPVSGCVAAWAG